MDTVKSSTNYNNKAEIIMCKKVPSKTTKLEHSVGSKKGLCRLKLAGFLSSGTEQREEQNEKKQTCFT